VDRSEVWLPHWLADWLGAKLDKIEEVRGAVVSVGHCWVSSWFLIFWEGLLLQNNPPNGVSSLASAMPNRGKHRH
jgi:hypothetical protein